MKFVNLFLKCENYNKSRFDEQILKVRPLLIENSFSFFDAEFTLFKSVPNKTLKEISCNHSISP
ncbi:hypothetical protein C4Q31_02965 [Leptospira borgpetersenii serovar Ceylonica]|nr:hypothetical protein C4Q31_02965 [Leptospira borgpetersenii serovar Ceylonica]